MPTALCLATGVGLALGLFGGGGSILSVAILSLALGMEPKAAIAASLLITGVTSAAALLAQRRGGSVSLRIGAVFGGAGMLGAFAGGRLSSFIPETVLLTALGATVLLTSAVMLRVEPASRERAPERAGAQKSPHVLRIPLLGLGIGVVAGTLGAGGGVLTVPALMYHGGLPMKRASATSLLALALQSLVGFVAHLGQAKLDWAVVIPFTLMATLGSVIGSALARHAQPALLRRGFAGFVCLVAVGIVVGALPKR
jgi:uncharacterized membrane protein YfcA